MTKPSHRWVMKIHPLQPEAQARRGVGSYRTCVIDVFIAFLRTRDSGPCGGGWCVWGGAGLLLKLSLLSPSPLSVTHLFPLQHSSSALCKTAQQHLAQTRRASGGCQGMAPSQGTHSGWVLAAWAAPLESSSASPGMCGDTVEPESLRPAPGHRAVGSLC